MPLSPPSSAEGDSHRGSPDTRLTAPSPGDRITAKIDSVTKADSSINIQTAVNNESVQIRFSEAKETEQDPFVSAPCRASKSGLSPTASAFNPFSIGRNAQSYSEVSIMNKMLSQDMGISRWVKIMGDKSVTLQHVGEWLQELESKSKIFYGPRKVFESSGGVGIFFDDIRDACIFHSETITAKRGWQVFYENPDIRLASPQSNGQVSILAATAAGPKANLEQAAKEVIAKLGSHGEIFAFSKMESFPDGSFRGIVEYCDVSAAGEALRYEEKPEAGRDVQIVMFSNDGDKTSAGDEGIRTRHYIGSSNESGGWEYGLEASKIQQVPSQHSICLSPSLAMYPVISQPAYPPNFSYLVNSFVAGGSGTEVAPVSAPISPSYQRVSTTYRKPPSPALTVQNSYSPCRPNSGYGRLDRRQNASRVSRNSFQSPTSHHNHVDVHRIREGTDVRTTIMLRNIPNKVDQAMLKRIVDESSWGKYDFMYLRIDFANDCNVGYAFINFVDPLDIIDFVEARGNQRWNCFKSDKVAEISYATIQGKDCLVQKFRNSSVMLEAAHYRPKLYFTSNGPVPDMAGQEEQFPEPDNQSKMKRSCENAEHVGLFTPNAGQHFRDEQRRRRSQYDRGTRLAALEEYDLEAIQHLYIGNERPS